jgi:hypothetical protein
MLKKSFYLLPILLLSVFAIGLFSLPGIAQPCPGNCHFSNAVAYGDNTVKALAEQQSIQRAQATCNAGCGGAFCDIMSTTCQYELPSGPWHCTTTFRYCSGNP